MKLATRLACVVLAFAAVALGSAQSDSSFINSAQRYVRDKMQSDQRTRITIDEWYSSEVVRMGRDEVVVKGMGRARRPGTAEFARFSYDVKMYTERRLAPVVNYRLDRWQNEIRYDDRYFQDRTRALVRNRLERELGVSLFVDFQRMNMYDSGRNQRGVRGSGVMYRDSHERKGSFDYDIRFDRQSGSPNDIRVDIKTRPGDWGNIGERGFVDRARQAVMREFSRDTTFIWRNDSVGNVVFGNRTVKGEFTARRGNKPGTWRYTVVLGNGTGDVKDVRIQRN